MSGESAEEQLGLDPQEQQTAIKHYAEMQSAPRFPLHLPVAVRSQNGACTAETQNISANGVLFAMDRDVPVGSLVEFTILLPGDVFQGTQDQFEALFARPKPAFVIVGAAHLIGPDGLLQMLRTRGYKIEHHSRLALAAAGGAGPGGAGGEPLRWRRPCLAATGELGGRGSGAGDPGRQAGHV